MSLKRVNFSPLHTFARATVKNVFQPEPDGFGGTDYILKEVASGAPAFEWNPETGESLGISIEEARTNLLTYSEAFDDASWQKVVGGTGLAPVVTPNSVVAPDGTMTADSVVFDVGAGTTAIDSSQIFKTFTATAVNYTGSIYLKGAVGGERVQVRDPAAGYRFVTLTTSWQRFDYTELGSTSTIARSGVSVRQGLGETLPQVQTVHIWGAQLEVGANPSSYIKTEATTVTRLADVCTIDDLEPFYNANEGSLIIEYQAANAVSVPFTFNNGSTTERIAIVHYIALNKIETRFVRGSVSATVGLQSLTALEAAGKVRVALSFTKDGMRMSVNGKAVVASGALSGMPIVNKLNVGLSEANTTHINGSISFIDYTPIAVTDAELIARSTL